MTAEKREIFSSFLLKLCLWCEGNTDRGFRVARPCRQILRLAGGEQGMPAHLAACSMQYASLVVSDSTLACAITYLSTPVLRQWCI